MKHKLPREQIDRIKPGDVIHFSPRMRLHVHEVDVIRKMQVDGEWKLTAGVSGHDHHACTARRSYEDLADRDFSVSRSVSNMTAEQEQYVRDQYAEA